MNNVEIDPSLSVAELTQRVRGAARVFEQLGIDYCCRGRQTLSAAVGELSLPLQQVVEALRTEAVHGEPPVHFQDAAQLISYIVQRHHKYTRDALARLTLLAEKVQRVHGERHPELARVVELVAALAEDLTPHMLKEEHVLFPYVAALAHGKRPAAPFGSVQNPVRMMEVEHEHVGGLFAALERVTGGYAAPADACGSYHALFSGLKELQADIHQHVHLENHVLFPMALALENAAA